MQNRPPSYFIAFWTQLEMDYNSLLHFIIPTKCVLLFYKNVTFYQAKSFYVP